MQSTHKSTPLIEDEEVTRITRTSKRTSTQRTSNDYVNHPVPNPFRMLQENMLPPGLMEEIGNLQYITPNQLQKIAWGQAVSVPRRSSIFSRHLQAMQCAVREQQQKMGTPKTGQVCYQQEMQQQNSLSLGDKCQQDRVSQHQRQRWALQPLQMQDEFLPPLPACEQDRPFLYYSMTELCPESNNVDDFFNI